MKGSQPDSISGRRRERGRSLVEQRVSPIDSVECYLGMWCSVL